MLKAYAAGVNAYRPVGPRAPASIRLLGVTPEPSVPMHSLASLKLLALGLSMNWDTELQRLELLRAIGPEHAARLNIVYPDTNPTILATHPQGEQGGATRGRNSWRCSARPLAGFPLRAG